jgi:hypothetical protein
MGVLWLCPVRGRGQGLHQAALSGQETLVDHVGRGETPSDYRYSQ